MNNLLDSKKIMKTKKLSKLEKRYCSCLMKVRSKRIQNPYGICTSAVYGKGDKIRNKVIECTPHYNFKKYPLKYLKLYAKEKKIKGFSKLSKKKLLPILEKYQRKKYNKTYKKYKKYKKNKK